MSNSRIKIIRLLVCASIFVIALALYFVFFNPDGMFTLELSDVSNTNVSKSVIDGVEKVGEGIDVVFLPKTAKRGQNTSVKFKGEPNKEYEIRVYYASGMSEAKSFLPKSSDENGDFGWEWKISTNARLGDIRIIVTGDSCRLSFNMEICESD